MFVGPLPFRYSCTVRLNFKIARYLLSTPPRYGSDARTTSDVVEASVARTIVLCMMIFSSRSRSPVTGGGGAAATGGGGGAATMGGGWATEGCAAGCEPPTSVETCGGTFVCEPLSACKNCPQDSSTASNGMSNVILVICVTPAA